MRPEVQIIYSLSFLIWLRKVPRSLLAEACQVWERVAGKKKNPPAPRSHSRCSQICLKVTHQPAGSPSTAPPSFPTLAFAKQVSPAPPPPPPSLLGLEISTSAPEHQRCFTSRMFSRRGVEVITVPAPVAHYTVCAHCLLSDPMGHNVASDSQEEEWCCFFLAG